MSPTHSPKQTPWTPAAWTQEVLLAALECERLGPSNCTDTPENRERCRARSRLMQLTTPKTIVAALSKARPSNSGEA